MIYNGIIENNKDPLKLGRVQVRIFGMHTFNRDESGSLSYIPTKDLPWAYPNISGDSIDSNTGFFRVPKQGCIVNVVNIDELKQNWIYFGSKSFLLKEEAKFNEGFSDPEGKYPSGDFIGESSLSRLLRNEKIDETVIQTMKDEIEEDVECASSKFSEPETKYNTVYPNATCYEDEKHIIFMDCTEGKEVSIIYHKPSGTFTEIHPDGTRVVKTKKDQYVIIEGESNYYTKGNQKHRIEKDLFVSVIGNVEIEVDGSVKLKAKKDIDIETDTKFTVKAGGSTLVMDSSGVKVNGQKIDLN